MKNNKASFMIMLSFFAWCTSFITVHGATTPSLGVASTYAVLGGTYSNIWAATVINGDIGFTTPPATPPLGVQVNYGAGVPTSTARTDAANALSPGLSAQLCTYNFPGGAVDLAIDGPNGATGIYPPGVYCNVGAMSVGVGGITLNGAGTYIFRTIGALTTVDNSQVTLIGASACDVFWTPTAATTLGATTTFIGTIIDNANAITIGANTTWIGRALSLGAGIVTTGNAVTITTPICVLVPATATLHIIKEVIGGTAIASLFNLHVTLSGSDIVGSPASGSGAPGRSYSVSAETYQVTEDVNSSYTQSFGGDCSSSGIVTLIAGDDKTCIVTNTFVPPVASSGPGGGILVITNDSCPNGDFSPNFQDGICGSAPSTSSSVSASIVPSISITKRANRTVPFPFGGGNVTYTYTVRNTGILALHDVIVTDNKCAPVSRWTGDTNNNNLLDTTEKWTYICRSNIEFSTTNIANAEGQANGFTARDSASATVLVSTTPFVAASPDGVTAPVVAASLTRVTPTFPNTGITPDDKNISWDITLFLSTFLLASLSFFMIYKNTHSTKKFTQD